MARQCTIDRRPGPIGRTVSAQAARPHGPIGWALGHLWVHETAAINDQAIALLEPVAGVDVLELDAAPAERRPRSPGMAPASPAWTPRP